MATFFPELLKIQEKRGFVRAISNSHAQGCSGPGGWCIIYEKMKHVCLCSAVSACVASMRIGSQVPKLPKIDFILMDETHKILDKPLRYTQNSGQAFELLIEH